ncbi:MAG: hypothetical protein JNK82_21205 [Myxococcaceae bacterium]|nr:hypothetical protein [Myxococcaceae bacterium]
MAGARPDLDELRAAVRELAGTPSPEGADDLVAQLASLPPSPEAADFITHTLEVSALHEVRDSRGVAVRWRLIDRLLALGFPHALLVSPEDLDYHRSRPMGSIASGLTVAAAALTGLWCLLWGALALSTGYGWWKRVVIGVIAGAVLHAGAAFVSGLKAATGRPAPLLKWLGWAFFIGPLATFVAQATDHHLGVPVFVLGLPSMVTALLCALTAARAGPMASASRVNGR